MRRQNRRHPPAFALPLAAALLTLEQAQAQTRSRFAASRYEEKKREANAIAVAIMTSGMTCTCARFAEDIRNVVNDLRPDGIRVLPILGVGGVQSLNDMLFLKNVEMAIVEQDNMIALKQRDPALYADIERRIHFIAKLYNSELHILARWDIKSLADLKGQIVNFNLKDSNSEVTADRVFNMLHIQTERRYDDVDTAMAKLRNGQIAAMIMLTGAPQSAVAKLKPEDKLHLLAIDDESLPGYDLGPVFTDYLPGELTHDMYPDLIPEGTTVQTVVNRALLVAYAFPEGSPQYRKTERFVNEFFNKIGQFKESGRHPKWNEINLWAEIPGWTRFKPAREWLDAHRNATAGADPAKVDKTFRQFLAAYKAKVNRPLSKNEEEFLLKKVKQFLDVETAKDQKRQ